MTTESPCPDSTQPTGPLSLTTPPPAAHAPSPLHGFHFTRDWLAQAQLPRQYLPDHETQIQTRLADLQSPKHTWQPFTPDEIAELTQFNIQAGNTAGAALAPSLANPDALVVVTGQQPDLLASPLYVLHKALSAVAWARKLSNQLNRPIIPIFWVASDDDDFAELKQSWHVAHDGSLVNLGTKISRGLEPSHEKSAATPAYTWDLAESLPRLQADLERVFAGWANGPAISAHLQQTLSATTNFETNFCRLLTDLLGPEHPMLFIAPRLSPFRHRQVQILQADIASHAGLNTAISAAAEIFEAASYPVTLHREPEALNFFWLHNGQRHRLLRRDGGVVALEPHRNTVIWHMSDSDLSARIAATPEEFAPNVVTRPVLQDFALPTLAYIAGPGELAYLALLGQAYKTFGKSRAAVIPRTLITMLPTDAVRRSACFQPPAQVPGAILAHGGDLACQLLAQISELMADATQKLTDMRAAANGSRPEVGRALDKTEAHIRHGIEHLKRRLARQVATDEWNRVSRLTSIVAPAGSSQERMLSPWNFVKAGERDALALHLFASIDYTALQPQSATLPPWVESDL